MLDPSVLSLLLLQLFRGFPAACVKSVSKQFSGKLCHYEEVCLKHSTLLLPLGREAFPGEWVQTVMKKICGRVLQHDFLVSFHLIPLATSFRAQAFQPGILHLQFSCALLWSLHWHTTVEFPQVITGKKYKSWATSCLPLQEKVINSLIKLQKMQ